jgi:hypothetical protein
MKAGNEISFAQTQLQLQINKGKKEKTTKVIQDVWNADNDGNRL